jgi:ribosome maturation factor RimP
MTLENQIYETIDAPLQHMGFGIVQLKLLNRSSGAYNLKVLEILIERLDGVNISVGDCVDATNHISALLDVEDLISSKYNLEVSSAGVERPVIKLQDFERFKDRVADIKLHNLLAGSKRHKCTLLGVDGNNVKVKMENEEIVDIDFENIKGAKLVFTDELFRKIIK